MLPFLAPLMLIGLVGVSIPIIIHLLNRRRYEVVDWGAMQFLQLSEAVRAAGNAPGADARAGELLEQARWRVLRAETSCNFFWGEAWVERCYQDLDAATSSLDHAALLS